jgi:hypothetical protein
MPGDLTPIDYAYLIILKIEGYEITNSELSKKYDVRLISPDYEKLNALGYVVSQTDRRPYKHVLTKEGEKFLDGPLVVVRSEPEAKAEAKAGKRAAKEKPLWAALAALHNDHLSPTDPAVEKGADTPKQGLGDRIRAAYATLADGPGDWVNLSKVRPLLGDVPKVDLDKAFRQLLDAPDVRIEPEPNRHRIDRAEREAAVRIGGEDRHKLAIGLR